MAASHISSRRALISANESGLNAKFGEAHRSAGSRPGVGRDGNLGMGYSGGSRYLVQPFV